MEFFNKIKRVVKRLIDGFLYWWGFLLVMFLIALVIVTPVYGYINNIVQLCHCDFILANPCKAEVIRLIGIPAWPLGCILGFIDINDNPNNNEVLK